MRLSIMSSVAVAAAVIRGHGQRSVPVVRDDNNLVASLVAVGGHSGIVATGAASKKQSL